MEARKPLDPFAMAAEPSNKNAGSPQQGSISSKTASRLADLLPRLLSGLALMVLALGAWWLGGDVFVFIWLAAAIAVFWEWQTITGGAQKAARLLVGGLSLVLVAAFTSRTDLRLAALSLGIAAFAVAALAGPGRRLWASSGLFYAGALIGSLCLISNDTAYGPRAILWLFAIVWGTDVCAYFSGRLFGGPKLWRRISPGKTWSGTLVGIACGALLGTFAGVTGLPAAVSILPVFGVSLFLAAVAQAGDIFESGMKRRFGVKDSSHLIPGHGGFMERLDGFIAAALFAVMIGLIHAGLSNHSLSLAEALFDWH